MSNVATIDRHLAFLRKEIDYLGKRPEEWAQRKVAELESIVETLTLIRRQRQMTGMAGRSIGW